jgi:molecular chaperone HtpG
MTEGEKFEFKAEIKKLLNILSKSLYQHKEIFLRELISNSSDAMKKIHFITLSDRNVEDPDLALEINITVDPKTKTMIVSDTGVGMTKEELVNNLGTIAGSGSEQFMARLKESQSSKEGDKKEKVDLDIIGQFGVGFYSVFMMADKVRVITKSYKKGEPAMQWESDGSGDFTIVPTEKPTRGTDVILYFKEDETEFLSQYKVEEIIKKYSNFVPFPVFVTEIKEPEKKTEVDMGEEKKDDKVKDAEVVGEEKKEEKGEEKKEEKEEEKKEEKPPERKPVNEVEPLWRKSPSEIKPEQYKSLYNFISKRYDNYAHVITYNVEGQVLFRSLLFIPETKSMDLFRPEMEYGLSLYSRNVMIMERCKEIIPQWMRFIYGVVDSEDFQNIINISRETIQSDRFILKISDLIVKKVINELDGLADKEPEKYKKIWHEFGQLIKEGVVTDYKSKDNLMKLLRFPTNKTGKDELIGLDEYIKRMKPDQNEIFYLVGENLETMKRSPHLGYYQKQDLEVILFNETVDNFLMMNVRDYHAQVPVKEEKKEEKKEGEEEKKDEVPKTEEKTFPFTAIDVTEKEEKPKDEKDKADKDKEKAEDKKDESTVPEPTKKFLETVKKILDNKITDAKISNRLYGSACRLANPPTGMSSSMQRAMRYWTMSQQGKDFEIPRKILEFNPEHPTVKSLIELHEKNAESPKIKAVVRQLFENCLLSEGDLPNPSLMVPRIEQLIEMMMTGNEDVKNPVDEAEEEKQKDAAKNQPVDMSDEDETDDADEKADDAPAEDKAK